VFDFVWGEVVTNRPLPFQGVLRSRAADQGLANRLIRPDPSHMRDTRARSRGTAFGLFTELLSPSCRLSGRTFSFRILRHLNRCTRYRNWRYRRLQYFGGDHLERHKRACLGRAQALLPFVNLPNRQRPISAGLTDALAAFFLFRKQPAVTCLLFLLLFHNSSLPSYVLQDKMRFTERSLNF
jgi:hypothetical protein